jgi:opacity protein-like surface antigen
MNSSFFRFTCFGTLLFLSSELLAQNLPTAKESLDVTAFGGYTYLSPDYGQYNDHGFMIGADVGRPFHKLLGSIDGRYTHATGDGVSETTFLAGPRIAIRRRRFEPYADLLAGYGTITFTHPTSAYTGDNSIVFAFGGGLNYNVWRNLSVKGDLTYQYWKLGDANSYMTPVTISAGLAYRIPISRRH